MLLSLPRKRSWGFVTRSYPKLLRDETLRTSAWEAKCFSKELTCVKRKWGGQDG